MNGSAQRFLVYFELGSSGNNVIFETKGGGASPACLYRKSIVCMSVRQRRIQLLLPDSPPSIMGTSLKKKAIPRDRRDEVKQSKNAGQKRRCFSLGDWNAGKEDDSLPGPNFDVPRDLFILKERMSVKTREVVHSLCNNISRHDTISGPTDRHRSEHSRITGPDIP